MDFAELKRIVSERVVRKCDCRNLNVDVDFLAGAIPTAEVLAIRFWDEIAPHVSPARIVELVLHETERNKVVYRGGA
jgi:6-pyruvoyl-tetrahydropterin synthase